jgi:3-dehydroquinate dehydratase type I
VLQLDDVVIGDEESPKIVGIVFERGHAQQAISDGADILEFRVDLTRDVEGVLDDIDEVDVPTILTDRRVEEGGNAPINRLDHLVPLLPHAAIIDIELMAPDRDVLMAEVSTKGFPTLISYHDLDGTPPETVMTERMRMASRTGDMVKLAVTIEHLQDVPRVLAVSLAAREEGMTFCVVPMGKLGSHLRPLMGIYGSSLLYGYVGKPISLGMLSVARMKHALDEIRTWH